MRKTNKATFWVMVVLLFFVIGLSIHSAINNDAFWNIGVGQSLTIIVAILLAFWATQRKNDQRILKNHAEEIVLKIQNSVSQNEFVSFGCENDKADTQKRTNLLNRRISNCISILLRYGDKLEFAEDAKYIDKEFKDYKELVSEHIEDFEYLRKSESTLMKYAENINSKCDQIILKMYM